MPETGGLPRSFPGNGNYILIGNTNNPCNEASQV
jgi:hypothetical protein